MEYKQTVSQLLKERFRDAFGDIYKGYYIGDPLVIPQMNLPCIIIEADSEGNTAGPTGHDYVNHVVMVKVVANKKDDFGKSPDIVLWRERLEKLVAGRDKTTGQYSDETVMGVLRKALTLGDRFVKNETSIDYGVNPRPQELLTEECHVTVNLRELVQVPART